MGTMLKRALRDFVIGFLVAFVVFCLCAAATGLFVVLAGKADPNAGMTPVYFLPLLMLPFALGNSFFAALVFAVSRRIRFYPLWWLVPMVIILYVVYLLA